MNPARRPPSPLFATYAEVCKRATGSGLNWDWRHARWYLAANRDGTSTWVYLITIADPARLRFVKEHKGPDQVDPEIDVELPFFEAVALFEAEFPHCQFEWTLELLLAAATT